MYFNFVSKYTLKMDQQELDQRLGEIQREYVDFLDDEVCKNNILIVTDHNFLFLNLGGPRKICTISEKHGK